jgi:homopolymeric O-antigen transport system permease protein
VSAPAVADPARDAADSSGWSVIDPSGGGAAAHLRELWRYRGIFVLLVWRDVKVRYKQTVLGMAWAVLQPLAGTLVFALFFGAFAGLDRGVGGPRYALYVFSGLLVWLLFANSVTTGVGALVSSAPLVSKVYFPRAVIPLAGLGVAAIDFAVSLALLVPVLVWTGIPWSRLWAAPLAVGAVALAAAGVTLLFAAVAVRFRDFRFVFPFFLQLWMFATPVVYPPSSVPERWRWVLSVNPLAGPIEAFRWSVLGSPLAPDLLWGFLGAALAFVAGAFAFRTVERKLADLL